jgi:hypothetical protein
LFFEIFLSAWGSKHVSASVRTSEFLLVLPGIRFLFVCVWLIKFWQNCATGLLSLLWTWSLSVFACVYSLCVQLQGNIITCVCVCACVCVCVCVRASSD